MKIWWQSWSRVRFRKHVDIDHAIALVVPGHKMVYSADYVAPGHWIVECLGCRLVMPCKQDRDKHKIAGLLSRETVATQHAQQIIVERCGVK